MSERKVVALSELSVKSKRRRQKKLPQWTPVLKWEKPVLRDEFWEKRGYGNLTEEDIEQVIADRNEKVARQHVAVDRMIEQMGIRKQNIELCETKKLYESSCNWFLTYLLETFIKDKKEGKGYEEECP